MFDRVSRLLQLGVLPIFVLDGKIPRVKERYFKKKHWGKNTQSTGSVCRKYFDEKQEKCEDLLVSLGVPVFKSPGEGEALCAFFYSKGIVSGVITQDNDAFLYGADVIYRNFSIDPGDSHVDVYCLKSDKNEHNLDRNKLVALALLLGCDYCDGVPGIGKKTALKLLSELECDDILQRFKDWKELKESVLFPAITNQRLKKADHCSRCGHEGNVSSHKKIGCSTCKTDNTCNLSNDENPCKCSWHINEELKSKKKTELKVYKTVKECADFPDMEVVHEYLKFEGVVPPDNKLLWTCPDIPTFQKKASEFFNWKGNDSFKEILPLVTAWQQYYKLRTKDCNPAYFLYEPVEVLKKIIIEDDTYFEVKWKPLKASSFPTDNLVTTEYSCRFSVSYEQVVDAFNKLHGVEKQQLTVPPGMTYDLCPVPVAGPSTAPDPLFEHSLSQDPSSGPSSAENKLPGPPTTK